MLESTNISPGPTFIVNHREYWMRQNDSFKGKIDKKKFEREKKTHTIFGNCISKHAHTTILRSLSGFISACLFTFGYYLAARFFLLYSLHRFCSTWSRSIQFHTLISPWNVTKYTFFFVDYYLFWILAICVHGLCEWMCICVYAVCVSTCCSSTVWVSFSNFNSLEISLIIYFCCVNSK